MDLQYSGSIFTEPVFWASVAGDLRALPVCGYHQGSDWSDSFEERRMDSEYCDIRGRECSSLLHRNELTKRDVTENVKLLLHLFFDALTGWKNKIWGEIRET